MNCKHVNKQEQNRHYQSLVSEQRQREQAYRRASTRRQVQEEQAERRASTRRRVQTRAKSQAQTLSAKALPEPSEKGEEQEQRLCLSPSAIKHTTTNASQGLYAKTLQRNSTSSKQHTEWRCKKKHKLVIFEKNNFPTTVTTEQTRSTHAPTSLARRMKKWSYTRLGTAQRMG